MNQIIQILLVACCLSLSGAAEFKTVWKKELPEAGLSGVCVKNGLVFFTVNDLGANWKEPKGFLTSSNIIGKCYDTDGNFKWEVKLSGGEKGLKVLDCWLDATVETPVANNKYVWFLNVQGQLVCCTHDGKVKWKKEFPNNAGITPSKMLLYKDKLIVSLPSGDEVGTKKKYYIYCLQALNPETGEVIWKSDKSLNHACRYDLAEVDGKPALLASVSELTHYKIGKGFNVYAISPDDGKCLKEVETKQFMQHFRCTYYEGKFYTISKSGEFNITSCADKSVKSFPAKSCDTYYQWSGSAYEQKGEGDLKSEVKHGNVKLPTKASLNLAGDKIFYFSGGTNAIGCYDLKSGKKTYVEVPYQIIKDQKIWSFKEIIYTEGVTDASGKVVMNSKKSHGYAGFGWGHVNIAEPLVVGNKLYWLGGVGVIYIIDLTKEFTPESIETVTIDSVGEAWTFGKMAFNDGHLYIRSQKDLFKVKIN